MRWAAVGWGVVLAFWPIAGVAFLVASTTSLRLPFELVTALFLGYASVSSFIVWVSFLHLTQHLFPHWPRWLRIPTATGLYFLVGIPLVFIIVAIRSLQGTQFFFWLQPSFATLVLLAWPFMIAFLAVFNPN